MQRGDLVLGQIGGSKRVCGMNPFEDLFMDGKGAFSQHDPFPTVIRIRCVPDKTLLLHTGQQPRYCRMAQTGISANIPRIYRRVAVTT